jgi:hypothetical protein
MAGNKEQMVLNSITNTQTNSSNLGGPFQGFSPKQTINSVVSSEGVMTRRILRSSWNTPYAYGTVNGRERVIGQFRAVNNLGDFLGRIDYVCGGPNQVNSNRPGWKSHIGSIISQCDGTGIPASVCNSRFVSDSSDYTTFKKQKAMNQNYNDLNYGGDEHNGSFVSMMSGFNGQ